MFGGGARFHSSTLSEGDPQRHLATLVQTVVDLRILLSKFSKALMYEKNSTYGTVWT